MKCPGIVQGVVLAAVLALVAGIIAGGAPFLWAGDELFRSIIALVTFGYVVYLFWVTPVRTGMITTMVVLCVVSVATWIGAPSLSLFVLIHIGAIWLIRSLYFHSGLLSALLDMALTVLSASAFVWADPAPAAYSWPPGVSSLARRYSRSSPRAFVNRRVGAATRTTETSNALAARRTTRFGS